VLSIADGDLVVGHFRFLGVTQLAATIQSRTCYWVAETYVGRVIQSTVYTRAVDGLSLKSSRRPLTGCRQVITWAVIGLRPVVTWAVNALQ
jgi:hypothetical protein